MNHRNEDIKYKYPLKKSWKKMKVTLYMQRQHSFKKQGQTVHMLQPFLDIYSISPPIYIYIYIIHIYIYTYIFTCSTLQFSDNIFIQDAMPEKAL